MTEQIRLYTSSAVTISRVAQLLQDQGIPSIVKNNVDSGIVAGFGTTSDDVDLYVLRSSKTKAEAILQDFLEKRDDS